MSFALKDKQRTPVYQNKHYPHYRFLEKAGYIERTDSREDRRAKKISLTSDGLSFIQNVNIAQSLHLKEIWSPLTHAECELFEDINKKLLTHIADVCP